MHVFPFISWLLGLWSFHRIMVNNANNNRSVTVKIMGHNAFNYCKVLIKKIFMTAEERTHDSWQRLAVWESTRWPFSQDSGLSTASSLMDMAFVSCWSSLYIELDHNPMKCAEKNRAPILFDLHHSASTQTQRKWRKWSFQLILMASPELLVCADHKAPTYYSSFGSFDARYHKIDWARVNSRCFGQYNTFLFNSHFLQQQQSNQRWNTLTWTRHLM